MKSFLMYVLTGFAMAGEPQKPGTVVDMGESLAKDMLRRGKVRLPTDDELRAAGHKVPGDDADEGAGAGSKPSDGLNVPQLKAALDAKNITYPADAKKADLAALLDAAPAA